MMLQLRFWLVSGVCLALVIGCQRGTGGRPGTVPVAGKVTYKGKPVAGAQVTFMAKQGGARAAGGTTDPQGNYKLTTFESNDGAVLGAHTVTISKAAPVAGGQMTGSLIPPGGAGGAGAGNEQKADYLKAMKAVGTGTPAKSEGGEDSIPAKYADPKASGLERTVTKEGPNTFNLDLE